MVEDTNWEKASDDDEAMVEPQIDWRMFLLGLVTGVASFAFVSTLYLLLAG